MSLTNLFHSLNIKGAEKSAPDESYEDYCVICMSKWENPKKLDKCGHEFCSDCIKQCFDKINPVCPICGMSYGSITGKMPPGRMDVTVDKWTEVPGYPGSGLIRISYSFNNGIQTVSGVFFVLLNIV